MPSVRHFNAQWASMKTTLVGLGLSVSIAISAYGIMSFLHVEYAVAVSTAFLIGFSGVLADLHARDVARRMPALRHHKCPHARRWLSRPT